MRKTHGSFVALAHHLWLSRQYIPVTKGWRPEWSAGQTKDTYHGRP